MFFIISSEERRAAAADFVSRIRKSPLMSVEIKPYKRNRSEAQNRLMWMWYHIISMDTGQIAEDLHEEMKVRVLGVEEKEVLGPYGKMVRLIVPKSSTKLSTQEMTDFLRAIEALAAELEIILPRPDDYKFAMMYEEPQPKKGKPQ